jgi:hypothetical protein
MTWGQFMQRSLDLWLLLTFLFLVFVSATIWRAGMQIQILRRRLEGMREQAKPPQERVLEPDADAVFDDWVPRR